MTLWSLLPSTSYNTVLCTPYNSGVFEMMRDYVKGVRIDELRVRTASIPFVDGHDLKEWVRQTPEIEGTFDEVETITARGHGSFAVDLQQFPNRTNKPTAQLTFQLHSTHAPAKSIPGIEDIIKSMPELQSYRLKTFTLDLVGPLVGLAMNNLSWTQIYNCLKSSRLHIGINSAVTILAYMMGIPTIMVSYREEPTWRNIGPHLTFLVRPTEGELRSTILEAL